MMILMFCPTKGFLGGSNGKGSACSAGDLGLIPRLGRSPGGGHGNPLQYSCLDNLLEQRRLTGFSPCSHKESDTTEQLSTAHTGREAGLGREKRRMRISMVLDMLY